ncbi:hypothetical protein EIP86_007566 [Pleurotus ostreatoroseus]|nr:hypothetical protein EIP86_007566 [Pleurotus ostreatoroseus]
MVKPSRLASGLWRAMANVLGAVTRSNSSMAGSTRDFPPTTKRIRRTSKNTDTEPDMSTILVLDITKLPDELIIRIFTYLDCQSLLACKQVCKFFDTITNMAEFRYKVELAAAGMEDGPPSALSNSDRLSLLLEHQAAWRALQWRTETVVPMSQGGVWEFYGGVLGQALARGREVLHFTQVPSELKGIEKKEWECELKMHARDFAMDPSQDLLVVVETQDEHHQQRVHLLSLSKGEPHPKACRPSVLTHAPSSPRPSFIITPCSEYVGVLFIGSNQDSDSELLIWNWQTGVLEMSLYGRELASFAFLSRQHVIVSYVKQIFDENPQPEPTFRVYDFKALSNEPIHMLDAECVMVLGLPLLEEDGVVLAAGIRSDPSPTWKPSDDLQVPFHTTRDDRLFVITFWVAEGNNITSLLMFLPSSTVLSWLANTERTLYVPWGHWGPEGTRVRRAPPGHSMVWVCYVHGQRFVAPYREGMQVFTAPRGPKAIQIFDFNQLAVQRALAQGDREENTEIIDEESVLRVNGVFAEPIRTSLPYLWRKADVPYHPQHTFDGVLIGEDAVVTVTSGRESEAGVRPVHRVRGDGGACGAASTLITLIPSDIALCAGFRDSGALCVLRKLQGAS